MIRLLICIILLFNVSSVSLDAEPEYAKWGAIAVKETQKRYQEKIVDYKHIGRSELAPNKSVEKFKLWLRGQEGKEFGVYVSITFDPSTENIQSIQFDETTR